MTISIRQITAVFAGEVSGVDITQPLSREDVAAIDAGMDRHAVLVFHDQCLTDDAQRAFTRNFGALEASPGGNITTLAERRLPLDMQDASNLDKDQKPLARDDRRRMFNLGNRLWHSDSSYRAVPRSIHCCPGASWWIVAAAPNSPTCAPPTMHWTMRRRPRSKTWSANIR